MILLIINFHFIGIYRCFFKYTTDSVQKFYACLHLENKYRCEKPFGDIKQIVFLGSVALYLYLNY